MTETNTDKLIIIIQANNEGKGFGEEVPRVNTNSPMPIIKAMGSFFHRGISATTSEFVSGRFSS